MRSIVLAAGIAAAILASPSTLHAADLTPRYKAPIYSPPVFSWRGLYIGLNAGYGFGSSNWDFPPGTSISPKGVLAGVTLGYNVQYRDWLWGIEGDLDYSGMKGNTSCTFPAGNFLPVVGSCETKLSWLGTVRGRFGYTGWTNWLPYITAGAAFGDVKATNSVFGSADKIRVGWVAGLGVEYALWTNWSVKGEYLYTELDRFDCGAACGAATDNVTFKANILRLGVNYRF